MIKTSHPLDSSAPPPPADQYPPPSYPGSAPAGFKPVETQPPPPGIHSTTAGYPADSGYVGSGYPQSYGYTGYPQYPSGSYPAGAYATGYPPGTYAAGYPPGAYPAGYPPGAYPAGYPPGAYPGQGYTATGPSPYGEPDDTGYNNTGILEDSTGGWQTFSDKAIRRVFIRKVYTILMIQLAFTTGFIALCIFEPHVKKTVRTNSWMYPIAYVLFIVLYFVLVCCESVRRKWPTNLILLSIFTMALSYMVGMISSYHDTETVLIAMGICAACCLAITLFSFNTKYDLTSCGGIIFIISFVLLLFGILAIFTYNRILYTVYAACGALFFMLVLAYNTQLLLGGKKHALSPEEHIFAALQLYLDIVYIFLFILALMGSRK